MYYPHKVESMNHPHPAVQRAYDKIEEISEEVEADLLVCDRCGHDMVVRATQVTEDPLKNDIRIKCPYSPEDDDYSWGVKTDGCGWWTRHGIPLTREQYEFEMERRDHRLVDSVNTELPDENEEEKAKERLRSLGYIEQ